MTKYLSTKQMFFFQSNCGTEASIYGSARTPNAEGFSSSPFSEANCLVSLKQEHGKLRVMFDTWVPENKRIQKGESRRSVNLDV